MKHTKIFSVTVIIFSLLLNIGTAQTVSQNQSMRLVAAIALPGVKGRIDHLAVDPKRQLVFVAALGNNTVEVVDLQNKKVIHTINNLREPQGIVFIARCNSIFVANGDNGECNVFNAGTYQKYSTIKLPGDADNVRYDSTGSKIYVGYCDGGIAIIDATDFSLISEIKLSGHPESFQLDKNEKKVFVNVPDQKQIEIIDLVKNKATDKWNMTQATSNFPMSLDETNHRLFIGCRNPAKLLILDSQTGKTISTLNIDGDVDDIFYDKNRKQIYLSCGGGFIDIVKQNDADTYTTAGKIPSPKGARTSLLVLETNMFILASPAISGRNASLMIYQLK